MVLLSSAPRLHLIATKVKQITELNNIYHQARKLNSRDLTKVKDKQIAEPIRQESMDWINKYLNTNLTGLPSNIVQKL